MRGRVGRLSGIIEPWRAERGGGDERRVASEEAVERRTR